MMHELITFNGLISASNNAIEIKSNVQQTLVFKLKIKHLIKIFSR